MKSTLGEESTFLRQAPGHARLCATGALSSATLNRFQGVLSACSQRFPISRRDPVGCPAADARRNSRRSVAHDVTTKAHRSRRARVSSRRSEVRSQPAPSARMARQRPPRPPRLLRRSRPRNPPPTKTPRMRPVKAPRGKPRRMRAAPVAASAAQAARSIRMRARPMRRARAPHAKPRRTPASGRPFRSPSISAKIGRMKWPNESDEYRRARDELLAGELELRRSEEAVAAQRRALPLGGEVPEDYVFDGGDGRCACQSSSRTARTRCFSTTSCSSRTSTATRSGRHARAARRSSTRSTGPRSTSRSRSTSPWSRRRRSSGFSRMRSHAAGGTHVCFRPRTTPSSADYNAESPDGAQTPIATVFTRRDGTIRHFWSSELFDAPTDPSQHPRHVDFMWPLWAMLDRTPEGRGTDWQPQLELARRCRYGIGEARARRDRGSARRRVVWTSTLGRWSKTP